LEIVQQKIGVIVENVQEKVRETKKSVGSTLNETN
jgi:hypothetical protein